MSEYTIRGREIYSDRGKLVATLDDDGNPVMAPGMAGPHSRAVREFLAKETERTEAGHSIDQGESPGGAGQPPRHFEADVRPEIETAEAEGNTTVYVGRIPARGADSGAPGAPPSSPGTVEEYSISTIPEEELPPFSREFGVYTPGFREFCTKHKLTAPQRAALVARLSKMKGKRNA